MVHFNLKNFPNVCRKCLKEYPAHQLISLDSIPTGCDGLSVAESLAEFTTEIPQELLRSTPSEICSTCLNELECFISYRKQQIFITEFIISMAELDKGNEKIMIDLLTPNIGYARAVLRHLDLCSNEEFSAEDFINEYHKTKTKSSLEDETIDLVTDEEDNIQPVEFVEVTTATDARPRKKPRSSKKSKAGNKLPNEQEALVEIPPEDKICEKEMIEDLEQELHKDSDDQENQPSVKQCRMDTDHQLKRAPNRPRRSAIPKECPKCNFKTHSFRALDTHLHTRHLIFGGTSRTCHEEGCNSASFASRLELIRHRKMVHRRNVCDRCGDTFVSDKELSIHQLRHAGKRNIDCPYCDFKLVTVGDLRCHIRKTHVQMKEVACSICGLLFRGTLRLKTHMQTHSTERRFSCNICGQRFKTNPHMSRHINNVHKAVRFKCDHCEQSYARKEKLRVHLEKTHDIQSYFVCDICLSSFENTEQLKSHKNRHDNPKHLECGICLWAFTRKEELDDHLCITYRKDYICCTRDWKYHDYYNKHKLLAHGIKVNARVKPRKGKLVGKLRAKRKQEIRCPKCEQEFPTRTLKNAHLPKCNGISIYSVKPVWVLLKDIRNTRGVPKNAKSPGRSSVT